MSAFDEFLSYAVSDTVNNGSGDWERRCGRCQHLASYHAITNGKLRCWYRSGFDFCDCGKEQR